MIIVHRAEIRLDARAGSGCRFAEARCACPPGLIQSELLALHSALRTSGRGSCVIGRANADVFLRRSVDVQAVIGTTYR
jgi:hypothetical protein